MVTVGTNARTSADHTAPPAATGTIGGFGTTGMPEMATGAMGVGV